MNMKNKKFIIGIVLLGIGIIGLLGLFSDTDNKISLVIGSVVILIVGIVLIVLSKRLPDKFNPDAPDLEKMEPYVFVTLHGKKFHYDPKCCGMTNPQKMDLSEAKAAGLSACDKCCYSYLKD